MEQTRITAAIAYIEEHLREELELTAHTSHSDPFFSEIEGYIVK